MDARPLDQTGADPEPPGRVVVAADEDGRNAEVGEPVQHLVEERDRLQAGQRPVVHVSGDQHGIHALGFDHVHQVVEEGVLGLVEALPVEGAPQMPVGGMQQSHASTLAGTSDRTAAPTTPAASTERSEGDGTSIVSGSE